MRSEPTIRFLIRDGAGQFIGAFDDVFRSDGATIIRTPPYTPVAKAHRSLRQRAPNDTEVVEYRSGQPIRRHPTCNGLINNHRQAA